MCLCSTAFVGRELLLGSVYIIRIIFTEHFIFIIFFTLFNLLEDTNNFLK